MKSNKVSLPPKVTATQTWLFQISDKYQGRGKIPQKKLDETLPLVISPQVKKYYRQNSPTNAGQQILNRVCTSAQDAIFQRWRFLNLQDNPGRFSAFKPNFSTITHPPEKTYSIRNRSNLVLLHW